MALGSKERDGCSHVTDDFVSCCDAFFYCLTFLIVRPNQYVLEYYHP